MYQSSCVPSNVSIIDCPCVFMRQFCNERSLVTIRICFLIMSPFSWFMYFRSVNLSFIQKKSTPLALIWYGCFWLSQIELTTANGVFFLIPSSSAHFPHSIDTCLIFPHQPLSSFITLSLSPHQIISFSPFRSPYSIDIVIFPSNFFLLLSFTIHHTFKLSVTDRHYFHSLPYSQKTHIYSYLHIFVCFRSISVLRSQLVLSSLVLPFQPFHKVCSYRCIHSSSFKFSFAIH